MAVIIPWFFGVGISTESHLFKMRRGKPALCYGRQPGLKPSYCCLKEDLPASQPYLYYENISGGGPPLVICFKIVALSRSSLRQSTPFTVRPLVREPSHLSTLDSKVLCFAGFSYLEISVMIDLLFGRFPSK